MNFALSALKRKEKGEKVRQAGVLPAVVYGAGSTAESVSLNAVEFIKLFKAAGESTLVDLSLDGAPAGKVIVQEVQHDPVKGSIIHADLRRIDMNKPLTAPVELKFVGAAPIIKEQGGTLVTTVHTVTVKCLPKDLVSHIDVDLSGLTSYDIVIKAKDLKLPTGIAVTSPHPEDLIVKVARALTEDEIKAMEDAAAAPTDLSKIEVVKKGKEEVEGEEAAAAEATAGKGTDKAAAPAAKKPASA